MDDEGKVESPEELAALPTPRGLAATQPGDSEGSAALRSSSSSSRGPEEATLDWDATSCRMLADRAFANKQHAQFIIEKNGPDVRKPAAYTEGTKSLPKRPISDRFEAGQSNSLAVGGDDSESEVEDADDGAAAGGGAVAATRAPARAAKRPKMAARALPKNVAELQAVVRKRDAEVAGLQKQVLALKKELKLARAAAEPEVEDGPGWFARPGGVDFNSGSYALLQRWRVARRYTPGDSWDLLVPAMAEAQVALHDEDMYHTGCCKAYALVLLLHYSSVGSGDAKPASEEVYARVGELRALLAAALDDDELARLKSKYNANRAGWSLATDLEHAKRLVALNYPEGRKLGHSMSPVWLEEYETGVVCADENVACFEFHSACASNWGRSHVQVVLPKGVAVPSGGQPLALDDNTEVVFVRRLQCHYHAVWVGGRARTPVRELPAALRAFLGI